MKKVEKIINVFRKENYPRIVVASEYITKRPKRVVIAVEPTPYNQKSYDLPEKNSRKLAKLVWPSSKISGSPFTISGIIIFRMTRLSSKKR